MIERLPLWMLCLALLIISATQTYALEGRVFDARSGEPLAGANISSGSVGTTTDTGGYFELEVAPGDSLAVSFIGYRPTMLLPEENFVDIPLQQIVLKGEDVMVVSGLREQALSEAAASITVVERRKLQEAGGYHFQDLMQAVPNLNWAGGTSRPRYFQIRGMGERSHYAGKGPPNFSVGFVLDDVELSGLGTAGVLFDLDQVEVFKGPQSTIFGPNAMAGLISLKSADPVDVIDFSFNAGLGSDALQNLSGWTNLPINSKLAVRLGLHGARSDGFRENRFLGRSDTNRRRENFARAKVRYVFDGGSGLLGTLFWADMDNGYDVWAPDNNEALLTYSNNPGEDSQRTTGLSLRGEFPYKRLNAELVSITAFSKTDLEHRYDGDWGNDIFWSKKPYGFDPDAQGWTYEFRDQTLRERKTFTQEIRLLKDGLLDGKDNAVLGMYFKNLEESDRREGYLFGGEADSLKSTFDIQNLAFYGQYYRKLGDALRVGIDFRLDRSATTYSATTDTVSINFEVAKKWLAGGKAALTYQFDSDRAVYAAVSRGYRAGGVNQHPRLDKDNRPFDPEYITNLEIGLRASGRQSATMLTLFHALRSDQQVNLSRQQDPGDPNSFFLFIGNASNGRSSGIELEQNYRPLSGFRLFGTLGYLRTHVDTYEIETAVEADTIKVTTQGNRAAAHAPEYTLQLGAEYRDQRGLFGQLEWTAKDEFYFSDSHNEIAAAHQLFNGRIGFEAGAWTLTLWGRNLLDERYAVRGFFFGLEPHYNSENQEIKYPERRYLSYGDPRQLGLSLSTDF